MYDGIVVTDVVCRIIGGGHETFRIVPALLVSTIEGEIGRALGRGDIFAVFCSRIIGANQTDGDRFALLRGSVIVVIIWTGRLRSIFALVCGWIICSSCTRRIHLAFICCRIIGK